MISSTASADSGKKLCPVISKIIRSKVWIIHCEITCFRTGSGKRGLSGPKLTAGSKKFSGGFSQLKLIAVAMQRGRQTQSICNGARGTVLKRIPHSKRSAAGTKLAGSTNCKSLRANYAASLLQRIQLCRVRNELLGKRNCEPERPPSVATDM